MASVAAHSFMDSLATYRHNCGLPGISLQLGPLESNANDSAVQPMKSSEVISSIMKAMMVPIPLQVIARLDGSKLAASPAYVQDPIFSSFLTATSSKSRQENGGMSKCSPKDAIKAIVDILRAALELQPNEKLGMCIPPTSLELLTCRAIDLAEPLTSCGADSITFAQFKGQVLKDFGVDVPLEFLAETYCIMDVVNHILDASQVTVGQSCPSKRSVDEATKTIVNMLREALELQPSEKLGT